jgi:hypothetical protein
VEISEIAELRVKEFLGKLTKDILDNLPLRGKISPGIFTCLHVLADQVPIPELQVLLFVAQHQPVKKSVVVREFQGSLGYSTIYRKLGKLAARGVLVDHDNELVVHENFRAIVTLANIHEQFAGES